MALFEYIKEQIVRFDNACDIGDTNADDLLRRRAFQVRTTYTKRALVCGVNGIYGDSLRYSAKNSGKIEITSLTKPI